MKPMKFIAAPALVASMVSHGFSLFSKVEATPRNHYTE
jgi:hypothetical protein